MSGSGSIRVPRSIAAAISLTIQVVVAVFLFGIISLGAIALNLFTAFCYKHDLVPSIVLATMRTMEYILWAADVVCFLLLIIAEVQRFCLTIWSERP